MNEEEPLTVAVRVLLRYGWRWQWQQQLYCHYCSCFLALSRQCRAKRGERKRHTKRDKQRQRKKICSWGPSANGKEVCQFHFHIKRSGWQSSYSSIRGISCKSAFEIFIAWWDIGEQSLSRAKEEDSEGTYERNHILEQKRRIVMGHMRVITFQSKKGGQG